MTPTMTGDEFMILCRQTAHLAHLPIIMMTVESEMQGIATALKAGANGYRCLKKN